MKKELYLCKPNFSDDIFQKAENVTTKEVEIDGVAPDHFYLTSHAPTYYKVDGKWQLPKISSLNCLAVLEDGLIQIKEFVDLKEGDKVVVGHRDDASLGIYKHLEAFPKWMIKNHSASVESSSTDAYDLLCQLMEEEKNKGHIVWVLGPAVVFDHDTRNALSRLARNGYVHALLGGNAMATHDLEGGYLGTALGQDIYTQESKPMGHYNHLDLLNEIRNTGSIEKFIADGHVKNGFIKELYNLNVPITLAGSVRDDGPLPEVEADMLKALGDAKKETDEATLIICLATMLHSISTARLASTYHVDEENNIKPTFLYTIDVTENAVNKVSAAREGLAVKRIVTNVQDFVVNIERMLLEKEKNNDF